MRWLIVLPSLGADHMGMDFLRELERRGHQVRTVAYRRQNLLYKNRVTKGPYERWILARLVALGEQWQPRIVLVVKGGPLTAASIRRLQRGGATLVLNFFPDNPLWTLPIDRIEAYDLLFTKERYAIRQLERVGLRNLRYLPMYCVPEFHHPVNVTPAEAARLGSTIAFVGSHYPYRERFLREIADYPVRVWGPGWHRADPLVRALVAGGAVWGRDKLVVYSGARLSLNHHHPMNDIVGVNTRTFELAAAGACQIVDQKDELRTLFKPGEEVVTYADLPELRRTLDYFLEHPEEARAIGANARRRALAEHTLAHRVDEMLIAVEDRFGKL